MKDSNTYAQKVEKLFRTLKKSDLKVPEIKYDDPLDALVDGVVMEFFSFADAQKALTKIKSHFIDYNDLRVSRPEEVIESLGKKNDKAIQAAAKALPAALNGVFDKFDAVTLEPVIEEGKRQAKKELEEITGLSKFVQSYCLLTSIGGHAIPVTETMAEYLKSEKFVDPQAELADIEGFLERRISATDAYDFYWLLRLQAEQPKKSAKKKTAKKTKKTAKKTAKKKAAPKTKKAASAKTKKKTAKKKTAAEEDTKKASPKTKKKTKKKTAKKATTKSSRKK